MSRKNEELVIYDTAWQRLGEAIDILKLAIFKEVEPIFLYVLKFIGYKDKDADTKD
jgi:hypothetical protein